MIKKLAEILLYLNEEDDIIIELVLGLFYVNKLTLQLNF